MADFFDQLELSVRAQNVLARHGVDTFTAFMELTARDVKKMKNAGVRTWREIEEIQEHARRMYSADRLAVVPGRGLRSHEVVEALVEGIKRAVYEFDGEITLATAVGALEIAKIEIVDESE